MLTVHLSCKLYCCLAWGPAKTVYCTPEVTFSKTVGIPEVYRDSCLCYKTGSLRVCFFAQRLPRDRAKGLGLLWTLENVKPPVLAGCSAEPVVILLCHCQPPISTPLVVYYHLCQRRPPTKPPEVGRHLYLQQSVSATSGTLSSSLVVRQLITSPSSPL